jgi:uncharacterized protein (TIGR00299 family) protein
MIGAYLDCHSGISGNMFLGALLDAGLLVQAVEKELATLPITGYRLVCEAVSDRGIRGIHCDVVLDQRAQPTRHFSDIAAILCNSGLAPRVRDLALDIFRSLAEAEAAVHGTSIEEVHFHEVGAVDAIVDIVSAAVGVELLGITHLYASPLPLTHGHVQTAHGLLPVPAPATLEILRRVQAPWVKCDVEGELVTPTGAAILATLARFEMPPLAIDRVGYGFGRKRLPWPNCLRLCLGQLYIIDGEADTDWVTVIEANIDNMSGELIGNLMERLLQAGALDVSYTPIQMKKNRPAVMVSVIVRPQESEMLAGVLLRETSTLGVRIQQMLRRKAQRSMQQLMTPFGPLTVKVKRLGTRVISATPEYDECKRIADVRDIPLSQVYEVAERLIRETIIKNV